MIHIVNNRASTLNIKSFIGQTVILSVDQDYRESLSMAHTASHLVALALNNTLSQCWKKEYALDCLGNKNFDQAAISYSNITPFCSIDKFRLGKSTKRRGVDVQYIVDNINEIEFKVNEKVNEWLALQSTSEMTAIGPYIDSVRMWHCYMGSIKLTLPCGGTHVQSINVIKNISVSMLINDKGDELTVKTEVRAK